MMPLKMITMPFGHYPWSERKESASFPANIVFDLERRVNKIQDKLERLESSIEEIKTKLECMA